MMTLHTKQLVATIEGMSRLLEASVTNDGFGPRGEFEDEGVQRDPVALVLDKLSLNLVQEPRAGSSQEEVNSCTYRSNYSYGDCDRRSYRVCRR